MTNFKKFFAEVWHDYSRNFLLFWSALYIGIILLESARQILIESMGSLQLISLPKEIFADAILKELSGNPVLLLPLAAMFLFNSFGYAVLYFSFSSKSFWSSISLGIKNIHRYILFLLAASVITIAGFLFLLAPFDYLLNYDVVDLSFLTYENNPLLHLLVRLILALPGLYILVSFSSAPFMLLLEDKSVLQSLKESHQRVRPSWLISAFYLLVTFAAAALFYYILWLIIARLQLALTPNLSFGVRSLFRIFIYSLAWVIPVTFYDLAVYHLYQKLKEKIPFGFDHGREFLAPPRESSPPGPALSSGTMKIVSLSILVCFVFSFVLVPVPVQAGGAVGTLLGTIVGIVVGCVVSACVGAIPFIISTAVSLVVSTASALITGTQTLGGGLLGGCGTGDFDWVMGDCTTAVQQDVYTPRSVSFNKFTFDPLPTPEEFAKSSLVKLVVEWNGDAPQGVAESMSIGTISGEPVRYISGTINIACTAGTYTATYLVPLESEFNGQIEYATCIQRAGGKYSRQYRPVCQGCGGGGVLVRTKFKSPSLPLPIVDIKANSKDRFTFTPGTPVTLSWTSEYATSCTASGSWSGDKPTSGSQVVTPTKSDEIYTLTCVRGEKSGSDSVSPAEPVREIRVFDRGGNSSGSSGTSAGLQISEFNVPSALNPGDELTISWSVRGATSCEVDNNIGPVPVVGSATLTFIRTTTFTLTCKDNKGNNTSARKTINVKKIPPFIEILPE